MRHDRNVKVVRMIPAPRTLTANGATVSAQTYGSGGNGLKGIVDTLAGGVEYDRVLIEISKQTGTAQKLSAVRLGMQSGANSVFTAACGCTVLSGYTSGIVLSAITLSAVTYLIDINLAAYGSRKRYLNCKVTTCTTSGNVDVRARLIKGSQFPNATTGYTTITNYG